MTKLFYYIWLPLNPILGEVTELFFYIWLPLDPIPGEVTDLFYYIWLPLNPIRGEVTDFYIISGSHSIQPPPTQSTQRGGD